MGEVGRPAEGGAPLADHHQLRRRQGFHAAGEGEPAPLELLDPACGQGRLGGTGVLSCPAGRYLRKLVSFRRWF